jgi:hypothetical protein
VKRIAAGSLGYQNDESKENVSRKHLVFGKYKSTIFSAVLLSLVILPKRNGNSVIVYHL